MSESHEELQSLLGAYALHAVEPEEAQTLEAHVSSCPRCRAELNGFLQAAPFLGSTDDASPVGLWEEITASIGDRRSAPLPRQVRAAMGRPRWRLAGPRVAAAFGGVVVVLGTLVGVLAGGVVGGTSSNPGQLVRDAASAAMASAHRTVPLAEAGGRKTAEVVIAPGAHAFFVPIAMPRLGAGRTYQLWAAVRGSAVSLGTLGAEAGIVEFHVDPAMVMFMVTAEPQGGVAQPDSPVLFSGRVPV